MNEQSFFNKISHVSLKELIDFMEHNQTEITLKIQNRYYKSYVISKKDKFLNVAKFSSEVISNEIVTCLFEVKGDKYFFKSALVNNNLNCQLDIPIVILQLQRRNDYRAAMPAGLYYKCEVISVNGIKAEIKAEIRDMSLGGCQISVEGAVNIKPEDELELYIKLSKFEFQKQLIIAKHIKFIDSQNNTLIGASFLEPDSEFKAELQAMMMYIDRVQRGKDES